MVRGNENNRPTRAHRLHLATRSRSLRREDARNRVVFRNRMRIALEDITNNDVISGICENLDDHVCDIGQTEILRMSFDVGDSNNIANECHSIHRVFPIMLNVKHLSFKVLAFGCTTHHLGILAFQCEFCKATVWDSELRHDGGHPVGKHCCGSGKVSLPPLGSPPDVLRDLLIGDDSGSRLFRKNIRAYNNSLAFVSLGAHLDERFMRGGGVYVFRIHGTTYHRIGPMIPDERSALPRYAQLYVFDTEHELQNRLQGVSGLDEGVLQRLQTMMHLANPYAQAFCSVREQVQSNPTAELKMVLKEERSRLRQYSLPTGSEVAAIMPGQGDESTEGHRDIVISLRGGGLQRISNLHRCYMPLMYVLLFPRGDDGWDTSILMQARVRNTSGEHVRTPRSHVTQLQYYAFRLQIRDDTIACLLRGGRLLQQFMVDAYSSIEESRLKWIRHNQPTLRAEVYQGLADMVSREDSTGRTFGMHVGCRIILPSSYTGGPRFMHQLYQDAMAIVRKRGKPDLFITFTCNPRWEEITSALLSGQTTQDRPDLTARVFYEKHRDMMNMLINRSFFGKVVGHVSVIEFQKRGLPHSHILLILENAFKPVNVVDYDKLVCAEFPDREQFPELFDIISHANIHGPCGAMGMDAPCMVNGRCKYRYPRSFSSTTVLDDGGYPTYMRRDANETIQIKGNIVDCRWIVPYNPFLSMRYKAHINVEICSTVTAVKYLYKYVFKGHDRATVQLVDQDGGIDEISKYLDARYVSASEACWRIFGYDLHDEKPSIQRLQVHLPMQNTVIFRDSDDVQDVVNNDRNQKTTLTEWFTINQMHSDARHLMYSDFPSKWVWNKRLKVWTARKQGNTIGRMYTINPISGELYYLRVLLTVCKGCTSFEDLRTFGGIVYPDFRAACLARGLLEGDEEWTSCLEDAALHKTGHQLRQLFVIILVFCEPVYPGRLWERFSTELSEDYVHALRTQWDDVNVCHSLAMTRALLQVQDLLRQHGKQLCDYPGLPVVDSRQIANTTNAMLMEEMVFDHVQQATLGHSMQESLNECQRAAYTIVLDAVYKDHGGIFFLDGPGGSGKTYLYNVLLCRLRGEKRIVLATASSGIAALLLSNGQTAHSRFKIPLVLNESSTCSIKVNSPLAALLRNASLIIWDEAPMIHRYAFEALDRTLQDIMQTDAIFGGKVILFGGDFRQVLPVVRRGSRDDIVNATLCKSYVWRHVTLLRLTQNMRMLNSATNATEGAFCKWLLDIGDGKVEVPNRTDSVIIPLQMLLHVNSLQGLIEWVYNGLRRIQDFAIFFRDRAVLAPRNQEVDEVNRIALSLMPGVEREYLSADSVTSSTHDSVVYTTEYLNSLHLGGGFPPHSLVLKQNAPIILLRNLDPRRGLCNGTRLICKSFSNKVIEAEVITGTNVGDRVFIPRIPFIPTSLELPFDMRRRQFPVRLAFGMTINKAQGQTLSRLGLHLATPVFTHGQLYVAMSRVRSSDAIKVCVSENLRCEGNALGLEGVYSDNVVYKEVLEAAAELT